MFHIVRITCKAIKHNCKVQHQLILHDKIRRQNLVSNWYSRIWLKKVNWSNSCVLGFVVRK
jgi:hypothetical protein